MGKEESRTVDADWIKDSAPTVNSTRLWGSRQEKAIDLVSSRGDDGDVIGIIQLRIVMHLMADGVVVLIVLIGVNKQMSDANHLHIIMINNKRGYKVPNYRWTRHSEKL